MVFGWTEVIILSAAAGILWLFGWLIEREIAALVEKYRKKE